MRLLSAGQFESFVREKTAAVVQFDAKWDVSYRPMLRRKLEDAEIQLAEHVNFGEVDCDENADLARSMRVTSVPLVAYYRNGQLVAALGGYRQNVRLRIERLLRGEFIGREMAPTSGECGGLTIQSQVLKAKPRARIPLGVCT